MRLQNPGLQSLVARLSGPENGEALGVVRMASESWSTEDGLGSPFKDAVDVDIELLVIKRDESGNLL